MITADGQYRRGTAVPLKAAVDEAVAGRRLTRRARAGGAPHRHRHQLDRARTSGGTNWSTASPTSTPRRRSPPNSPCSCSTPPAPPGNPRASCTPRGGYLTQAAYTHHAVFDHKPGTDVFWCTADIGWVTGHSYIVYGPLANRATEVIYEGTPNTPHEGRHWEIIDKYGVTIYYTAPTLIRTFMKWGADIPGQVRPRLAAGARQRRRTDQPRGLDVVPAPPSGTTTARSWTPGGRPRPAAS